MKKNLYECDWCGGILREHETVITVRKLYPQQKKTYDLCFDCVTKNYKPGTANPFYFIMEREAEIRESNL